MRRFTLFTGQWSDLPLDRVAELATSWGYDGLELACWGDHLDVVRLTEDDAYLARVRDILERHGLGCWAISNHLTGQAVCDDPIDERHQAILPPRIWGNGEAEGVRQRAAEEMKTTGAAARLLGVDTVVGFTGSAIWKFVAMFPPVSAERIAAGYRDFADRWTPILDSLAATGARFALEVHPSEIAYDYWTTQRALQAISGHPAFGLNFDPSHMFWQGIDPVTFLLDYRDRILHVDCKDTRMHSDGRSGLLGSHLPWGDPRRAWDFVSTGRGNIAWESIFRTLNAIGYPGPISVEWEDAGMDRLRGAGEALEFLKRFDLQVPALPFDAAFNTQPGRDHTGEDGANF